MEHQSTSTNLARELAGSNMLLISPMPFHKKAQKLKKIRADIQSRIIYSKESDSDMDPEITGAQKRPTFLSLDNLMLETV